MVEIWRKRDKEGERGRQQHMGLRGGLDRAGRVMVGTGDSPNVPLRSSVSGRETRTQESFLSL